VNPFPGKVLSSQAQETLDSVSGRGTSCLIICVGRIRTYWSTHSSCQHRPAAAPPHPGSTTIIIKSTVPSTQEQSKGARARSGSNQGSAHQENHVIHWVEAERGLEFRLGTADHHDGHLSQPIKGKRNRLGPSSSNSTTEGSLLASS